VVGRFRDRFRVVAMAAGTNLDLLTEQVKRFSSTVGFGGDAGTRARACDAAQWRAGGDSSRVSKVRLPSQLIPTPRSLCRRWSARWACSRRFAAIKAGKDIAFANKEVLVHRR